MNLQVGDKVIYCIKSDSWNGRTKKVIYAAKLYHYSGIVVEISGSTATLDLEHHISKQIRRKKQCPIRNIKKVELFPTS